MVETRLWTIEYLYYGAAPSDTHHPLISAMCVRVRTMDVSIVTYYMAIWAFGLCYQRPTQFVQLIQFVNMPRVTTIAHVHTSGILMSEIPQDAVSSRIEVSLCTI